MEKELKKLGEAIYWSAQGWRNWQTQRTQKRMLLIF
jgi:hypothetical protein